MLGKQIAAKTPRRAPREASSTQQFDLFMGGVAANALRDDRILMEFPFFSLQKQPRMAPIEYIDDRGVNIRVSAGEKGIATIWDKDVLLYCATVLNERIEKGLPVNREFVITPHHLLAVTRRAAGGKAYQEVMDALERLHTTTIVTNIESAKMKRRGSFHWIDNYIVETRKTKNGRERLTGIRITLNDWTFQAITKDRRVLSINPAYFDLPKGLERRLYEIARKHCGYQGKWHVHLETLARKCATTTTRLRDFKSDLLAICEANRLPDYEVKILRDPHSEASQMIAEAGLANPSRAGRMATAQILVVFTPRPEFLRNRYPSRPQVEDAALAVLPKAA